MKFFQLIDDQTVRIAPDNKVIPSKDFALLTEAKELLDRVKDQAVSYREEVAKECEVLKERAELAGFEAGLEKWNEHLKQLELEIQNVRQEMEQAIVPLALTAVKKIIGRELEEKPETIIDIISTALKAVSQHRKISIYVTPNDLELVENNRPTIKALFEHLESLSIAARPEIEPGGCIIETEAGIINAQLENQLNALETAFQGFFKSSKRKG